MKTLVDPFPGARKIAEDAFSRWVPRTCSPRWLEEVTGPARFGWDVDAIQRGFVDPIYRIFDARPERWRPALTASLVAAGGADPGRYPAMLAAIELLYLASLILEPFRNGRNIAEASPQEAREPMPVAVTVAYTARQMAPTLAIRHEDALPPATRSWLAYRITRALYQSSVGVALDTHRAPMGGAVAGGWHLALLAAPTFALCVDCALAALGRVDHPEAAALQAMAGRAGVAYRLVVDLLSLRDRARGDAPEIPPEPVIWWSPLAMQPGEEPLRAWGRALEGGRAASVLAAAREHRRAAKEALESASGSLAETLRTFLEKVVDARVAEAEEALHAE